MNEWKLTSIPKILHVYWGGGKLPYLRYLTIATFTRLNPDWIVKFHRPTQPGANPTWNTGENKTPVNCLDYTDKVLLLPGVIPISHELPVAMNDIHRSDFLRWQLLSTEGGVWSDMDIIFTKPISQASFNTKENQKAKVGLCSFGKFYQHRIGFLFSAPNYDFFKGVLMSAQMCYNPNDYQSAGSNILNSAKVNYSQSIINISKDTVYPLHADQIFDSSSFNVPLPEESIGLHWYAGHPLAAQFMNTGKPVNIINKYL